MKILKLYRAVLQYKKEVYRLSIGCERCTMSRNMIDFAHQWLEFVTTQCEKGRGVRPRWALPGLDFLQSIVDPQHTQYLTDEEFEVGRYCLNFNAKYKLLCFYNNFYSL
jgi:mitogen-activated protein kinase kinase kinase 4